MLFCLPLGSWRRTSFGRDSLKGAGPGFLDGLRDVGPERDTCGEVWCVGMQGSFDEVVSGLLKVGWHLAQLTLHLVFEVHLNMVLEALFCGLRFFAVAAWQARDWADMLSETKREVELRGTKDRWEGEWAPGMKRCDLFSDRT